MNTATAEGRVQATQMIIRSELMKTLMRMIERVARSDAAVLITGETGTGKELVARAVHQQSLRSKKPWVDVNCAALPEHLVESELFGYEKGAFSGADSNKPGLFELANEGTLFLDEIGDLDPKVQVKLLRVLDGAPYYRLGAREKIFVDVRTIAATNQDLHKAVATGKFRSDLYHRLSQFQLKVPPLRKRPEDIPALAEYFLNQYLPEGSLSGSALDALRVYSWPGNIRELRNVIIQAASAAHDGRVTTKELPLEISHGFTPDPDRAASPDLGGIERDAILSALGRNGGNQTLTAQQLGISRRTLCRKLKQYREHVEQRSQVETLGVVRPEQQHKFRFRVSVPVAIKTEGGEELSTNSLNISLGGMSVTGVPDPQKCGGVLQLSFILPSTKAAIQGKAEVVWSDGHGTAGLCFLELLPASRAELSRWLMELEKREGWHIEE